MAESRKRAVLDFVVDLANQYLMLNAASRTVPIGGVFSACGGILNSAQPQYRPLSYCGWNLPALSMLLWRLLLSRYLRTRYSSLWKILNAQPGSQDVIEDIQLTPNSPILEVIEDQKPDLELRIPSASMLISSDRGSDPISHTWPGPDSFHVEESENDDFLTEIQ